MNEKLAAKLKAQSTGDQAWAACASCFDEAMELAGRELPPTSEREWAMARMFMFTMLGEIVMRRCETP